MSEESESVGFTCLNWWNGLHPKFDKESEAIIHRGDPATLARLRRSTTPLVALQQSEVIRLAIKLGCSENDTEMLARVGAIAGVLAHVKTNEKSQSIAKALGPQKKDELGAMSVLRFRNLLAASNSESLMREMRHTIKLLKGNVNVYELATAMYYWGDKERTKWTYNYWQKGFAAPEEVEKSETAIAETTIAETND